MALSNSSSESSDIIYTARSIATDSPAIIKFSILLIFQVASVCCSLFLLFHLIMKTTLYRALHNHTIIALVIVSFFQTISDLPMTLEYIKTGEAPTSTFCLMWNFFAFSNYAIGIWIMTWTSLERHLLIFHSALTATFRGKILFHYIPLFFFSGLPWIYYIFLVFLYPCTNTFYPSFLFCGFCCYAYNDQLVLFNWTILGVIPICSIAILNVSLIVRVVLQKRRVQQHINWRQHRRMTIQLLCISCLYIFFDAPTVIIGLVRFSLPTFALEVQELYLFYIAYLLPLLLPFVCLSTFRELWNRRRGQIHPIMTLTQSRTMRRN